MAPLKRAANISSSNEKPKLRRICYDEKASHLNQVLMLSVLRDDEKGKKKEAKKKTDEKWTVENGIQFGTSVGGDLGIWFCAVFLAAGHRDKLSGISAMASSSV